MQAKKHFLAWANSETGIEVSPDVDLFHSFSEVGHACHSVSLSFCKSHPWSAVTLLLRNPTAVTAVHEKRSSGVTQSDQWRITFVRVGVEMSVLVAPTFLWHLPSCVHTQRYTAGVPYPVLVVPVERIHNTEARTSIATLHCKRVTITRKIQLVDGMVLKMSSYRALKYNAQQQDADAATPPPIALPMLWQGYRGVLAIKDIPRGVALVRLARSCCLGPETTDEAKDPWTKALAVSSADASSSTTEG